MTIREFAELANVSVSTVSKILNRKDAGISAQTRERVLRLAEEYHFAPYSERLSSRTFLLGIMLAPDTSHSFLTGVVDEAKRYGYGTIVYTASNAAEELENARMLLQHHVTAVLWCSGDHSSADTATVLRDIPHLRFDERKHPSEENITFLYSELGRYAAAELVLRGHRSIGVVLGQSPVDTDQFLLGMNLSITKQGIHITAEDIYDVCGGDQHLGTWMQNYSALICTDEQAARTVYAAAENQNLRIPDELSLVMLAQDGTQKTLDVSAIVRPYRELGRFAVKQLMARLENSWNQNPWFSWNYELDGYGSIAAPRAGNRRRIVVVGTINSDTLISVGKYPETGETVGIRHSLSLPGGKGLNQAITVSRLNTDACLIAKLGRDYDGRNIYHFLRTSSVNFHGVSAVDEAPTGHAYIFVQRDAESGITILDGANRLLSTQDIDACGHLFSGAEFCLLQTELDIQLVEYAAQVAKCHGAKVILKPCVVDALPESLLKHVDILVPNQKEAQHLLPDARSVEEQAERFHQMGAETVIITMGAQGCYLYHAGQGKYFAAAAVESIDTTGAADVFIATLAVYLSVGHEIAEAVRYATLAAGISTTRYGVSSSVVDRDTLELYRARQTGKE